MIKFSHDRRFILIGDSIVKADGIACVQESDEVDEVNEITRGVTSSIENSESDSLADMLKNINTRVKRSVNVTVESNGCRKNVKVSEDQLRSETVSSEMVAKIWEVLNSVPPGPAQ